MIIVRDMISARDRGSVIGTHDQYLGQMTNVRDRSSMPGMNDQC